VPGQENTRLLVSKHGEFNMVVSQTESEGSSSRHAVGVNLGQSGLQGIGGSGRNDAVVVVLDRVVVVVYVVVIVVEVLVQEVVDVVVKLVELVDSVVDVVPVVVFVSVWVNVWVVVSVLVRGSVVVLLIVCVWLLVVREVMVMEVLVDVDVQVVEK